MRCRWRRAGRGSPAAATQGPRRSGARWGTRGARGPQRRAARWARRARRPPGRPPPAPARRDTSWPGPCCPAGSPAGGRSPSASCRAWAGRRPRPWPGRARGGPAGRRHRELWRGRAPGAQCARPLLPARPRGAATRPAWAWGRGRRGWWPRAGPRGWRGPPLARSPARTNRRSRAPQPEPEPGSARPLACWVRPGLFPPVPPAFLRSLAPPACPLPLSSASLARTCAPHPPTHTCLPSKEPPAEQGVRPGAAGVANREARAGEPGRTRASTTLERG